MPVITHNVYIMDQFQLLCGLQGKHHIKCIATIQTRNDQAWKNVEIALNKIYSIL